MSPTEQKQDSLSGTAKILIVLAVVSISLWGCAKRPSSPTGAGERIRVLESRCQKLEQDYRSVVQSRDKARKELAGLIEENASLQQQFARNTLLLQEQDQLREQLLASQGELDGLNSLLAQRTEEVEELRQQLIQRIAERDQYGIRLERLRQGFQQLLTQDDNPVTVGLSGPTLGSD